ncbi:YdiY family protein [Candidatus Riflebacteria bacterium]
MIVFFLFLITENSFASAWQLKKVNENECVIFCTKQLSELKALALDKIEGDKIFYRWPKKDGGSIYKWVNLYKTSTEQAELFFFMEHQEGKKFIATITHAKPFRLKKDSNFLFHLNSSLKTGPEQIRYKNGDRVSGKILDIFKEKIIFLGSNTGKLEIGAAGVDSIETTRNSTLLSTLLKDSVAPVIKNEKTKKNVKEAKAQIENKKASIPAWKGSLSLDTINQDGNTDRTSHAFSGEATLKRERDKIFSKVILNYAEEAEKVTSRNSTWSNKYDLNIQKGRFVYFSLDFVKDKFKELDLRTAASLGMGFQVFKNEKRLLELEAGLGRIIETFIDGEDSRSQTARAASRFEWYFSPKIRFKDSLVYTPIFKNNKFLLRNESEIVSDILQDWAVKLAHILDFDSMPSKKAEKVDRKLTLGLQHNF